MIHFRVDPVAPDPDAVRAAADAVVAGEVIALPTDTLYGLAVNPHDADAVDRLFRLKGRPPGQPVPLIATDLAEVERWAGRLDGAAGRLAAAFWPGPLTLLVRAWPQVVADVHGGTGAVGVRVPAHYVARAVTRAAGLPLVATSANLSGEPPPSRADAIHASIASGAAVLLDAGPTPGGLPSTIVDVRGSAPVLVRAGAIAWERVLEFV